MGGLQRGTVGGIRLREAEGTRSTQVSPVGGIGKEPSKRTEVFMEFERHFARLLGREQRLVGVDKVRMFLKSVDRDERMKIGV